MKKIYNRFFSAKKIAVVGLLSLFALPGVSYGQLTYTIGTGTSTNGTTSGPCPFGNWYMGIRNQYLFTAAELNAAGFTGGSISEIAFEVASLPSPWVGTLSNYKVYIGTTNVTSMSTSSFQTTPSTLVHNASINPVVGWNSLAFSTPFVWNGTDNLLIQVCYENSSTYTRNPAVYYTSTSFNSVTWGRADNTPSMCSYSNAYTFNGHTNRPNIRFSVIPPVADDAGVIAVTEPGVGNCSLGSLPTSVILNNFGTNPLLTCTINWSVNGSLQSPVTYNGDTIQPQGGISDTVSLGNFSYNDGDVLKVWTSNPNQVQDSFPDNDTLYFTVYEALGGTYTIGGANPDYDSISTAARDLMERGVCSAAIFNIRPGTYSEQVMIGSIPGTSASSYVMFQAETDTSLTEITWSPSSSTENYVVSVNGASHVMFKDLTIENTSSSFGTTIELKDADYSSVYNCILNGGNGFSANMTNVNISGGMNVKLEMNEINNGYRNLNVNGTEGAMVLHNTMTGAYYGGAYFSGTGVIHVNYNDISSQSPTTYGDAGIEVSDATGASRIIGNKISWPNYYGGIYAYNLNGSANGRVLIANNMIGSDNYSFGWTGIYVFGGFCDIVHNTVALNPSSYQYNVIYIGGGANVIKNNMVYSPNASTSTFYGALNYNGSFAVSESDYNNVYSSANFGRLNSGYATLSDWQNATGFDMNSTSIDPMFTNYDSLRICNDSLDGTGTPFAAVSDDFDGDGRNLTTPDVGADEWVGSDTGAFSAGADAIICDGKTAMIGNSVNGGTFNWNTGDTTGTIEVSEDGVYIVSMTTSCGATHVDTVEVTDVTPTATFTQTNSFLTGSFDNGSNNGLSYMWVVGTTPPDTFYTEDLTYVFADNGPYDVTLYTMNDCDTVSSTQTWQGFVGIDENELSNSVSLMPNPTSDVLNMVFTGVDGDVTIEMTNIQGQVVYTERLVNVSGNATKTVDVSNLNKGMYIVRFMTNNDVATKQVIVK